MSRRGTNIRKRADGRWEGRYYIVDKAGSKKCKSVYGHSYKEVTERLLTAKAVVFCGNGYSPFLKRIKQDSPDTVFYERKAISCLFT